MLRKFLAAAVQGNKTPSLQRQQIRNSLDIIKTLNLVFRMILKR
jgi:hypothetical protein